MSAFNQARFNLAQYNISSGAEAWAEGSTAAAFIFSFAGETLFAKGNTATNFSAELYLDSGRIAEGNAAAAFANQSYLTGYLWTSKDVVVLFAKDLNLSQEAYAEGDGLEELAAELNLSQEAYIEGGVQEAFNREINLSQEAYAEGDAGEVFSQTSDVGLLSDSVCAFPELILKPGQTLIIDAGSYNVLLDGKNAIHLQSGEWLDNLSRDTLSIEISGTGVSRLQAQILYIERYL